MQTVQNDYSLLKSMSIIGAPKNRFHFGRAIEYAVFSKLLLSGGEIFLPAVDDDGVDVLVKRPKDQRLVQVQIKAKGKNSKDPCMFAAITHRPRQDYWFLFYAEKYDKMWILSSDEFLSVASQNVKKEANHLGKYSINFGKNGDLHSEYVVENFNRILY